MSDYRAIAGVSRTLRNLLRDRMEDPVDVTIAPPDVEVMDVGGRRLNLYLFEISRNAELANQEVPGEGHPAAYGHPPLSLDLHYLFTAYGSSRNHPDADLEAQQILGDAMSTLHDFAIVTQSLAITRPAVGIVGDPLLDPALRGEFERVKITLKPVGLDDLSNLWAALPDANFRRSVAYQVSVVQIESRRERRFPVPVGAPPAAGPAVLVVPLMRPQIGELRFRRPGPDSNSEHRFSYGRIGDTLVILGVALWGDRSRVLIGDVDVTASVTTRRPERVELTIPDHPGLQPGATPVKVVHDVLVGNPPSPRPAFSSNATVFMLVPRVDSLTPDLNAAPKTLRIDGARLFHPERDSLTLVGDELILSGDYTTSTSGQIEFDLPDDMDSGDYAVRVRVGGAESIERRVLTIPP